MGGGATDEPVVSAGGPNETLKKRQRSSDGDTSDEDPQYDMSKRQRSHNLGSSENTLDFFELRQKLFWIELCKSKGMDRGKPIPRDLKLPFHTLDWTAWITHDPTQFVGSGAFGEVYHGKWNDVPQAFGDLPRVVVKVVRVERDPSQRETDKRYKKLRREITIWNDLQHPHIVPFVGICRAHGVLPALISLYMENGDVLYYLKANPDVNRGILVIGVALGLEFLHSFTPRIIHGDLKGANVLINNRGWPCLVDFGVSRMIHETETTLWHTTAHQSQGTMRWQAPELFDGSQTNVTAEGDVYAFAMTGLEIITGKCPFSQYRHDGAVFNAVMSQESAYQQPEGNLVSDFLWQLYLGCWKREPKHRPSMQEILRKLIVCTDPFASISNWDGRSILSLLASKEIEGVVGLIQTQDAVSPALVDAWRQLSPLQAAQILLEYDSSCANREDLMFRTPIYYASECGFYECVRLLLTRGNDVLRYYYEHDEQHPLYPACENGHDDTVRLLLPYIAPSKQALIYTAFDKAVLKQRLSIIQIIVAFVDGVTNAEMGMRMKKALYIASVESHESVVRLLLDWRADVQGNTWHYGNALQAASVIGHESIVQLLLNRGADVQAKGGYYGTALHAASYGGHLGTVQLLLDCGADVQAEGGYHGSALHAALYKGHLDTVRLLLDRGADVDARGVDDENALYAASHAGNESMVRLLLDRKADVQAKCGFCGNALQAASYGGHLSIVQLLLDRGADVQAEGGYYKKALYAASSRGHLSVVRHLLDRGAAVEAQGGSVETALQAAESAPIETRAAVVHLLKEWRAASA